MHDERTGKCVIVYGIAADGDRSLAFLLLRFELFGGLLRLSGFGLGRLGLGFGVSCFSWARTVASGSMKIAMARVTSCCLVILKKDGLIERFLQWVEMDGDLVSARQSIYHVRGKRESGDEARVALIAPG